MQGGRRGGGGFPGFDPFADFGGFGGFGGHSSMLSSIFGGRDSFDDPFFTRPFGSSFPNMFETGMFGPSSSSFASAPPTGFIEHQEPQHNKRRGPVIEELSSDDEKVEDDEGVSKSKDHSRKHGKFDKEPYVEVPDDESGERRSKQIQHRNEFGGRKPPQSQSQCFTFQSSSVSYGGDDGAYYTKSMTRRAGSDGVAFEEFKEADSTTGQTNHRISRGLHNKGHTLSRKLDSGGKVDTTQTLHNLEKDELPVFEQAWEGSAGRHFPGLRQSLEGGNTGNAEPSGSGHRNMGGWALPSTQHMEHHNHNHNHNHNGNPHVMNWNAFGQGKRPQTVDPMEERTRT